jgi:hypothetical protein
MARRVTRKHTMSDFCDICKKTQSDAKFETVCDSCNTKFGMTEEASQMSECSCPVCPLVKANVQTCIVIVHMMEEGYNIMPEEAKEFHEQFAALVRSAMAAKLRVKQTWEHTGPDHNCYIKRIDKEIYKICFHTINSVEPMD